jgi:hypothetical protein
VLVRDAAVGVGADERVAVVVQMDGGRYTWDGVRPCWTFGVKEGPGTGKMMGIEVLIYE